MWSEYAQAGVHTDTRVQSPGTSLPVSRPAPQRFSRRCQQSGRSSQAAFCVLRKRTPLPELPVRRWSITALVPAACATSHMIPTVPPLFHKYQLMRRERKGIQIVSSALKMRREPKSNPLMRHRYPSPSPFLLSHIYLHVSLIYLKPSSRSRLNFNFTHRGGKLDQIFLESPG